MDGVKEKTPDGQSRRRKGARRVNPGRLRDTSVSAY